MLQMSMSFRMGKGWLEHNLRVTKENRPRQNGVLERRHFNEQLVIDESIEGPDYVKQLIHKKVEEKIGDKLKEVNEKHIRQGNLFRVRTVDQWIESQQYTRAGKQKDIVCEYIVQLGDKYTGCPYEIQLDADGNMLDVNGKKIKPDDTRFTPAYRDGKITESKISKKLKKVYKEFFQEFKKRNPQAEPICASIHGDEKGGLHMHINCIWFSKTKNGVGYGLSKTTAMRQQYDEQAKEYGKTRKQNAQNMWRNEMRYMLMRIALDNGIERVKMNNKEPHREHDEFCDWKDDQCARREMLDNKEKELIEKESKLDERQAELDERDKKYASAEWWYMYKHYPELWKEIHNKCRLTAKIKAVDNSK